MTATGTAAACAAAACAAAAAGAGGGVDGTEEVGWSLDTNCGLRRSAGLECAPEAADSSPLPLLSASRAFKGMSPPVSVPLPTAALPVEECGEWSG